MAKKSEWQIEREKIEAEQIKAINALTKEQAKALKNAHIALQEFVMEWSDMFDLSGDTPRKLQNSLYEIRHQFQMTTDRWGNGE